MTQPEQKPFRSKQNYGTPTNFLDAAKRRLGITRFEFDFAADDENAKADHYWTEADDSLSFDGVTWSQTCKGWGWLNPPFTTIGPWAKRCREMKAAGGSIAFLVPAAVGANWFRDHVDGHALVLLLNGRLAFMPDKPTWLYPKDCVLCLYSPSIAPGYEVWDWRKVGRAPVSTQGLAIGPMSPAQKARSQSIAPPAPEAAPFTASGHTVAGSHGAETGMSDPFIVPEAAPITRAQLLIALQHVSRADTERILERLGFTTQEIADAIR